MVNYRTECPNELSRFINELVAEREKLVGVAQGLDSALVARRVSDDEIAYIVDKITPAVKSLIPESEDKDEADETAQGPQFVEAFETLLSVEMLTVLQLVGFNFKAAIGEPLTDLVKYLILAQIPQREPAAERCSHQRDGLMGTSAR